MDSGHVQSEPKGFVYKGVFSETLDTASMREHISHLLSTVRGDKPVEEHIFANRKVFVRNKQRN